MTVLPPRRPLLGRGMKNPEREQRRLIALLIVAATVAFGLLVATGVAGIVDAQDACERYGQPGDISMTRISCEIGEETITISTQASFLTILLAGFGLVSVTLIGGVYRVVRREAERQRREGA